MPEKYTSDCSNLSSARRTLSYTCPFPASRVWGNKNLRFDRRFAGYEEKTWAVCRWFSLLAPRVSRIAVLATIPNRERALRTFLLFSVLFSFSLLVLSHRFPTKMSVYSSTNQRERTRTLSTDPGDRKGDECDTVASSLTISTAKRFVTYSYYDWFGVVPASVFFSAFSWTNFNSCSNSFKDVLKFLTAYAYRIDLCSFSASDSACFDKSLSAITNRSYCARTYLCDVEDIHQINL